MTMNNISENTKDSSTNQVSISELITQYVKHPNGAIFHVMGIKDKPGKVYLRSKNNYQEFQLVKIKQGLIDGSWLSINEHELRKHIESENAYLQGLTMKLVSRTMFTQILIELDDNLKDDFEDDKYVRNILDRSEKQFTRLVKETYPKMYSIDKQILQSSMKKQEEFIKKCASLRPDEFFFLNDMIDEYFKNPKKYQKEVIYLEKIDAE